MVSAPVSSVRETGPSCRGDGGGRTSQRGDKVGGNRMQDACLSLARAAALDQELPRVEACGGGG